MLVVKTKQELKHILDNQRIVSKTIGFVPTMGALHNGHLSLIDRAKSECDFVVCSIFVNPTQFNDPLDLEKYPKPIEKDIELLESVKCDLLFLPDVQEMYANTSEQWNHSFGKIETLWEGKMRPGHFAGVGQIVLKLFEAVEAHKAYFGQKDYQQTVVVKKLCTDFKLRTEIVVCPIIREENGLAMSSRNIRLSNEERSEAGKIFEVLTLAKDLYHQNKLSLVEIIDKCSTKLLEINNVNIEYFSFVHQESMEIVEEKDRNEPLLLIVALRIGNTRLIDNMII